MNSQTLTSLQGDDSRHTLLEKSLAFMARRAMYMLELPRIADALDEASFMQRGLEMAEELTDSKVSFIHFVNEDEKTIELVTWSRRTLESYCHAAFDRHYPVSEAGIWAEALRHRQPVVFNDYATAPGKHGLPEGHAPLQRLISLPVIEQGKIVMLVGVGNKASDYGDQDIETLQLVANDVWHLAQRGRAQRQIAENMQGLRELNQKLEAAHSQLLQSEKMASIGQLAAGVAHELNNPIGFVTSNLGSLESYLQDIFSILDAYAVAEAGMQSSCPELNQARQLKLDRDYDFLRSDIVQLLSESREGLGRVAKIVRDLKDFSRAGEASMQWADLHQGIETTLNVVWNELKYKCTVVKDYGDLPQIWCEPSQLNQVFMNLLVNAGHAIQEKGEITIRTGRQGSEVFVAIGDTGTGIASEHLNRIFEPFFTTKPIGKGTGLGLSLAYGIVQKHHGRIEVQSKLGKGTTFTVWLPIDPVAPAADAVPPAPTFA
ncbi:MAG: GAF domain-containing protein [Rhodocyclaceae bacterium]|nr:GAF domain-containing protein [Rhodocyclaceae bacterium]MDZ4213462.1 GAF domain-containing protein [Rhodocyclaceae bacterium]